MPEKLHCNNTKCEYHNAVLELCTAKHVYYINKLCMTFKIRSPDIKTTELMQTFKTNCDSNQRGYKTSRITKVLK